MRYSSELRNLLYIFRKISWLPLGLPFCPPLWFTKRAWRTLICRFAGKLDGYLADENFWWKLFVSVPASGGTWSASRVRWWATSPSPSTSPASSWAASITLTTSPEPCTSGLPRSRTCHSPSAWTDHCLAVRNRKWLISDLWTVCYVDTTDGTFLSTLGTSRIVKNRSSWLLWNIRIVWSSLSNLFGGKLITKLLPKRDRSTWPLFFLSRRNKQHGGAPAGKSAQLQRELDRGRPRPRGDQRHHGERRSGSTLPAVQARSVRPLDAPAQQGNAPKNFFFWSIFTSQSINRWEIIWIRSLQKAQAKLIMWTN